MSDLISKEKLKDYLDRNISFGGVEKKFAFFDIIDSIPSVDIIEHARAIKKYCKKYNEHCVGCPFHSAKPTKWCELGSSSLPYEWDLPERESQGGMNKAVLIKFYMGIGMTEEEATHIVNAMETELNEDEEESED